MLRNQVSLCTSECPAPAGGGRVYTSESQMDVARTKRGGLRCLGLYDGLQRYAASDQHRSPVHHNHPQRFNNSVNNTQMFVI